MKSKVLLYIQSIKMQLHNSEKIMKNVAKNNKKYYKNE